MPISSLNLPTNTDSNTHSANKASVSNTSDITLSWGELNRDHTSVDEKNEFFQKLHQARQNMVPSNSTGGNYAPQLNQNSYLPTTELYKNTRENGKLTSSNVEMGLNKDVNHEARITEFDKLTIVDDALTIEGLTAVEGLVTDQGLLVAQSSLVGEGSDSFIIKNSEKESLKESKLLPTINNTLLNAMNTNDSSGRVKSSNQFKSEPLVNHDLKNKVIFEQGIIKNEQSLFNHSEEHAAMINNSGINEESISHVNNQIKYKTNDEGGMPFKAIQMLKNQMNLEENLLNKLSQGLGDNESSKQYLNHNKELIGTNLNLFNQLKPLSNQVTGTTDLSETELAGLAKKSQLTNQPLPLGRLAETGENSLQTLDPINPSRIAVGSNTSFEPLQTQLINPINSNLLETTNSSSNIQQGLSLKHEFSPNLALRIQWIYQQALSSAEILMDPPELGPLNVKLNNHNGETNIVFQVTNASTKEAIEDNLAKLKASLEEQGITLGDTQVEQQQNQESSEQTSEQAIPSKFDNNEDSQSMISEQLQLGLLDTYI